MTAFETVWLFLWLFTKHAIVDFPLQSPYQYLNKGTYGHPGGILHSALHGGATTGIVYLMFPQIPLVATVIGLVDFVVHYHVDWAKMNINKALGWGPTTHEQFWWLLGLDQFLHALTYVGIAAYLVHTL